jgi:hypothetical protein
MTLSKLIALALVTVSLGTANPALAQKKSAMGSAERRAVMRSAQPMLHFVDPKGIKVVGKTLIPGGQGRHMYELNSPEGQKFQLYGKFNHQTGRLEGVVWN